MEGPLQTNWIIGVAKPLLKSTKGTIFSPKSEQYPIGLFSLIMAVVSIQI